MIPQTPPKRTTINYVYGPGAPIGYQPPPRLTNCVYGPGVPIGYQPGAPITNSGPGGPDCEAKSIRTCRCSPATWKPITMPNRISPEEARRRLRKGIRVENPLGEKVTLDSRLEQHWQRANKSQADINARLAALPLIEEVVKNPAEIWENPNGSRTYLSSVVNPYQPNGKSYTVAFTQSADNTVLETYHINDRITSNKRQGKQLWPKR